MSAPGRRRSVRPARCWRCASRSASRRTADVGLRWFVSLSLCPVGEGRAHPPGLLYISTFIAGVGFIRFRVAGGVRGGAETNLHKSKENKDLQIGRAHV